MDFKALPKIELHAHLTGSISPQALHTIWKQKQTFHLTTLEDPLLVMSSESKKDINLKTFFPLFSNYMYSLLPDAPSIRYTALSVLRNFQDDGVVYLELRTTPRATSLLSVEEYVEEVVRSVEEFERAEGNRMRTRLILCVDRRMSVDEAQGVLDLAVQFKERGVVGIDLCGDPASRPNGEVDIFTPIFQSARQQGLHITVHFAEAPVSASPSELQTLLSWHPERLGHCIWEDDASRQLIRERNLCLELCLSCNVQAGMTRDEEDRSFAGHHFGLWSKDPDVKVSLGTDDVGVFGSPLSEEYRLAAEHFGLNKWEVCKLAREGVEAIFGGEEQKERLRQVMWTPSVEDDVDLSASRKRSFRDD